MSRKPKCYYEPWTPSRSSIWELGFLHGRPVVTDEADMDQVQRLSDWEASRKLAEQNAPWILWGTGVSQPSICGSLDGTMTYSSDQGIIAIQKSATWPDKSISHEHMAKRIAACVSACAGIADPEKFIADVRSMMLTYAHGEASDPRDDPKVFSLLERCIPPEEMEQFDDANNDS